MRLFRAFCSQKDVVGLDLYKFASPSTITCKFGQNSQVSRQCCFTNRKTLHCGNRLDQKDSVIDYVDDKFCSQASGAGFADEKRRVWTIYDPISGGLVTKRGIENGKNLVEEERNSRFKSQASSSHLDGSTEDFSVEPSTFGVDKAKKENQSGDIGSWAGKSKMSKSDSPVTKKKGKNKVDWVCSNCGHSDGQWWGICRACDTAGTMKQFCVSETVDKKPSGFEASENALRSWLPQKLTEVHPLRLTDVNRGINQLTWRIPL